MKTFSDLKVGDEVLLKTAVNYLREIVEKVTEEYIIVKGKEYNKKNGVNRRGPWFGEIYIPSEYLEKQVKRRKQRNNALME